MINRSVEDRSAEKWGHVVAPVWARDFIKTRVIAEKTVAEYLKSKEGI